MDLELTGKIALVTGGSRGLGRATALRLAVEGCDVAICGRTPSDVQKTVADLEAVGRRASGCILDVLEPGETERFVEESVRDLGGVDLLVANVGAAFGGGLLNSTPEDWSRTFELNVGHAIRAIRAAVPVMRGRGGGAVVIVSSISGWKPAPRAQYGAAKAAEIYAASALARELANDRIRVNAVSPGSILIPEGGWDLYRQREPQQFHEFERRDFPAQRLGTAGEIADVTTFLLSQRASWINGANICVDGAQGRPSAVTW
ncbi:MAG: SDR family NAD(P)-dependent oxidoreductase [Egibacteraceae bacterium]